MTPAPHLGHRRNAFRSGILWVLGAAGLLLMSCLIPQDIDVIPEPPPTPTHPPRIVLEKVQPADQAVLVIEKECTQPVQFRVDVYDEDTDQKIQVRWFVNYPDNVETWSNRVQQPTGSRVRQIDPFELDPSDVRLLPDVVYPVDVVVADEFESDASTPPANRAVKNQPGVGASSTYRWVVWMKTGPCQGGG